MSENFNARAELEVSLNGLRQLINDLQDLSENGADADQIQKRLAKSVKDVSKEYDKAADRLKKFDNAAKSAKGDMGVEQRDLREWDELSDRIKRAELEYKGLSRVAAASGTAGPDPKKFLVAQGISEADIKNYQRGSSANLLRDAELEGVEASLPRLRYALYDVATTAGVAATAISGIGVAAIAAYSSMESSFTNVERTLDGITDSSQVAALREELVGLTREIPLTFANISEIATLGNQLGIASEDIAQFTETTAKFSAVTGLTAEASAQAFGSLGELLNVQARDYEALGSSIALVGRRSVATEQEIVSMTTRLAASATNAGFTAQQVIALSGAFASLRIAPERAQGVMEIYFKQLNNAIAEGGPRLEAFARVAGVTTAEVENLVRTDPVEFFQRLAVGLGQMDQIAQTGALAELGLQGIRAGEVFGRVSANVEVFNKALDDANQGWIEGTELGDQYAKVVDDLASRWQIFLNAVQNAGSAVASTMAPALGVVIGLLTKMLEGFTTINEATNGWLVGPIAGIAALVAATLGFLGVGALFLASLAAMRTALNEVGVSAGLNIFTFRGLAAAASQVGTAMGFSAANMRAFKIALAGTGIGLAVVALGTLAAGFISAAEGANGLNAELEPFAESLSRAIEADTATFNETGQAIRVITKDLQDNAPAADRASVAVADYLGIQSEMPAAIDGATRSIREQTIALGENADAQLRRQLADNEGFSSFVNNEELMRDARLVGFEIDKVISGALAESGGAMAYIDGLRAELDEIISRRERATSIDEEANLLKLENAYRNVLGAASGWASELDSVTNAALESQNVNDALGISASEAAAGYDELGNAAHNASNDLWGTLDAAMNVESSMFALGQSIANGGTAWDIYSEAGRANLAALKAVMDAIVAQFPNDSMAAASNIQALYNTLLSSGAATIQQLGFMKSMIDSLAGGVPVQAAQRDFSSLFQGIRSGATRASRAVRQTAKEVRTLVDYANDLSSVMSRAFDIRFGPQQGLDDIASGWNAIRESTLQAREGIEKARQSISAAREAIAEHRMELNALAADKRIKQYWLMVAENYGDELRAAKLRAELADLSAKMADEQKGLADEQKNVSKGQKELNEAQAAANLSLTGNTEAAIENRASILGLVSSYQDYIKALAASGMSQKDLEAKARELKAEFIQQATQMGFNRAEVNKYAKAFDDMRVIINKVPRKVTITANANPALQAIKEFEAKAKSLAGKKYSGGTITGPKLSGGSSDAAAAKLVRKQKLLGEAATLNARLTRGDGSLTQWNNWLKRLSTIDSLLKSGKYQTGGFTGPGGVSDVAGIVHKREFVFSAPATRTIGVNNLNAMHNLAKRGKMPVMGTMGGAGGMVELSPYDRQLLVDIRNAAGITISERSLQSVVNGSNGNFAQRRSA